MSTRPPALSPVLRLVALLAIQACLSLHAIAALAQEVGTYSRVEARALNLRTAPNTASFVLRALPRGTSVSILDRKGAWARVFVQGGDGKAAEGWVAARFLGRGRIENGPEQSGPPHVPVAPLRVSKFDFDCRPALFGNSGIRKCVASVRVQLARREFDPERSDHVPIACRGAISYRTDKTGQARRLFAIERTSIARDDRLGQSVRVSFPVPSASERIVFARLAHFSCGRD